MVMAGHHCTGQDSALVNAVRYSTSHPPVSRVSSEAKKHAMGDRVLVCWCVGVLV